MTTKPLRIISQAPTRIDLAGGTLDLWPLYLFLKNPTTLNLGISLFAEATLDIIPIQGPTQGVGKITITSLDQGHQFSLNWEQLARAVESQEIPSPSLELHYKLLKYFYHQHLVKNDRNHNFDLHLSTSAKSPAGAGLGGSSSLSIAIIGALASFFEPEASPNDRFINIVKDIETTVIQVPAGMQDYYGALFGSLQSIKWGIGGHQRQSLPQELLNELENRLLLFYSGQSRNSGINNWVMYKNFIDRTGHIRQHFEEIAEATLNLEQALLNRDWIAVREAICSEWEARKKLAPSITTPEIDSVFKEIQKLTPMAGKICGAGGGGCFFIYLAEPPSPSLKKQIQQICQDKGIRPLPFQAVPHGLKTWRDGQFSAS